MKNKNNIAPLFPKVPLLGSKQDEPPPMPMPPLKVWHITDSVGGKHVIEANAMFTNDQGCVVFHRAKPNMSLIIHDSTELVATFFRPAVIMEKSKSEESAAAN